jgi:hypothetical protein
MLSISNAVVGANNWLIVVIIDLVEASNNWGDEIWSPPIM